MIPTHVSTDFDGGPFILMHGDLNQQNILVDNDYNITGIIDWEWSTTVPFQLFAMPPTAIHPYKTPTPAELVGEEKEMFMNHVNEFLECFQQCEKVVNAHCPIWHTMLENWTSGRYWFHSALVTLWDLDYPFWEYVFPRVYPDKSEMSFIEEFKTDSNHSDMHAIVRKKIEDLEWYKEQVGKLQSKG
jgi:hypothetical protein